MSEQVVVIVGAGMAGLRAAEAIRANGFSGAIKIYGAEPYAPYNRPPLSKDVLAKGVDFDSVVFRQREATADVTWILGQEVANADLNAHTVTTNTGETVSWDALVIATGVRPRRLDLAQVSGRFTLRTLDDAISVREHLKPGAKVVIAGAGFIGCEAAATAIGLGCEVTAVSLDAAPMIRPLGLEFAQDLQARHMSHGVKFALGRTISSLRENAGMLTGVILDDGTELPADILIEAINSHCNVEWLSDNDIDIRDGVLVDSSMHAVDSEGSRIPGVYALGDVARFANPLFDETPRRIEHWNIPTEMAKRLGPVLVAELNQAAEYKELADAAFTPMPAFWSDQFDLKMQGFGMPSIANEIRLIDGAAGSDCIYGYFLDDRLVGVIGIGMTPALMALRKQIAAG